VYIYMYILSQNCNIRIRVGLADSLADPPEVIIKVFQKNKHSDDRSLDHSITGSHITRATSD